MIIQDNKGNTPIHISVKKNFDSILKMLLEFLFIKKEEIIKILNIKNKHGNTPLHLASYHKDAKCMSILLGNNLDDILEEMNFNVTNKHNKTPLHIASELGNLECGKLFIFYKIIKYSFFLFKSKTIGRTSL